MLRIFSAAALLALLAAGCGGGARPQRSAFHGVPPALAQDWEGQASAIAAAAAAGDDCRARQLAHRLSADVAASEHKLPLRLRSPLVTGVNRLAARIACAPPTPQKPKPPPKPAHEHKKEHGHHGRHGHGDEGGGGG